MLGKEAEMYEDLPESTARLQQWLSDWPAVRRELEGLMGAYAELDPSLHFQLTLATLELNDIDEAVHRLRALGRLLASSGFMAAEMELTGHR